MMIPLQFSAIVWVISLRHLTLGEDELVTNGRQDEEFGCVRLPTDRALSVPLNVVSLGTESLCLFKYIS